jgi:hypothetical protein
MNCKSVFLDFAQRLYFNKVTFWKLDLLPSSGKKNDRNPQPGGPTARVSALPFYLKTEEDPASETL